MSADGENYMIGTPHDGTECCFCTLSDATMGVVTMRDDPPDSADFTLCDDCAEALGKSLVFRAQRNRERNAKRG